LKQKLPTEEVERRIELQHIGVHHDEVTNGHSSSCDSFTLNAQADQLVNLLTSPKEEEGMYGKDHDKEGPQGNN